MVLIWWWIPLRWFDVTQAAGVLLLPGTYITISCYRSAEKIQSPTWNPAMVRLRICSSQHFNPADSAKCESTGSVVAGLSSRSMWLGPARRENDALECSLRCRFEEGGDAKDTAIFWCHFNQPRARLNLAFRRLGCLWSWENNRPPHSSTCRVAAVIF